VGFIGSCGMGLATDNSALRIMQDASCKGYARNSMCASVARRPGGM
jgi:hypothetical protein